MTAINSPATRSRIDSARPANEAAKDQRSSQGDAARLLEKFGTLNGQVRAAQRASLEKDLSAKGMPGITTLLGHLREPTDAAAVDSGARPVRTDSAGKLDMQLGPGLTSAASALTAGGRPRRASGDDVDRVEIMQRLEAGERYEFRYQGRAYYVQKTADGRYACYDKKTGRCVDRNVEIVLDAPGRPYVAVGHGFQVQIYA